MRKNCGLLLLCCISSLSVYGQKTKTIEVLLAGLREVIEAGKVYVENTDRLADKAIMSDCAYRYSDEFTFLNKEKMDEHKNKIAEYFACLKSTSENEYDVKNPVFNGFERHIIEHADEEEYKSRHSLRRWFTSANKISLPHPLAVLRKIGEEVGKFAFVNTVEGLSYKPRDRFVVTLKDALLLLADREKYGEQALDTKLKEKLTILDDLCSKYTVFRVDEKFNAQKQAESEHSAEVLTALGQKIAGILASADSQRSLAYEKRVEIGIATAQTQFPLYSSILREKAKNKKVYASLSEFVKIGDEIIKTVERIVPPTPTQEDIDAQYFAIGAIISYIHEVEETRLTKSVKKAEYKEKNPLESAFKLQIPELASTN